ncbi:MAG TPA: M28 family peptidase [Panacibacter sp.]|mgnify:FL=1|nr:M28 family peptidase [Panacibacter sp.]HNP45021.1 M28 family peptidase [Panacibacter sp.]
MKKLLNITAALLSTHLLFAQDIKKIINADKVAAIESRLAADDMQGRKINSPGIEKAATFISNEFREAGLKPLTGAKDYFQRFTIYKPTLISQEGTLNEDAVTQKNTVIITTQKEFSLTESAGYEKKNISSGDDFFSTAFQFIQSGKNYIVDVDSSFSKQFVNLNFLKRNLPSTAGNVIFFLNNKPIEKYNVQAKHSFDTLQLMNVAGMLPGKSRKEEYVIFSGHYDHLGIGKPVNGDSIYNGANDDASGTTAVIMLARYFKALNNNNRTLIFTAFTGEESGGFGSRFFSRQFDPANVMAMFNIEMIGTTSKWGTNSAYITGYEKTDMGKILQQNLKGSGFEFYPDPYAAENLFYRSDNATLARLGVPAHTISTSKMDSEPNYHKVSDEISTLDMENMAAIIRSIALSARSIISGTATPTRVDTADLK